jgi:vacuolar protein sorting-associated protein 13A/C
LGNLKLRAAAFEALGLPIKPKGGFLKSLVLKVPWKRLKSDPVVVHVDGVYLFAETAFDAYRPSEPSKEDVEKALKAKLEALKADRIQALVNFNKKKDKSFKLFSDDSFAEGLVTKILDNLQINVANVHVRVEDVEMTGRRTAFGVTLAGFSAQSVDENGAAAFVSDPSFLRKSVILKGLALYWETPTGGLKFAADGGDFVAKMAEFVTEDEDPCGR